MSETDPLLLAKSLQLEIRGQMVEVPYELAKAMGEMLLDWHAQQWMLRNAEMDAEGG